MTSLLDSVSFASGTKMSNRFMLAPLTNQQSHADGTLSNEEHHWLTMRAQGGFGLTMTCAAHVQKTGQGFAGQLATFGDEHIPGLKRLARDIKFQGSLSIVQLHHAGQKSPADLIGRAPMCPSDDAATGAQAMTNAEVYETINAFVDAAVRCEKAGFEGVELHGAHGYLIGQFLSPEINQRTDEFGGSLDNRAGFLLAIIDGIRRDCRDSLNLSVRLSPERFGLKTSEMLELFGWLVDSKKLDFIDMSMWDVRKDAVDEDFAGKTLMEIFGGAERGNTRLGVAGKIYSAADAQWAVDNGADFAVIGRAAIAHHDFARLAGADPDFTMRAMPIAPEDLRAEGLSDGFIEYMKVFKGFVAEA